MKNLLLIGIQNYFMRGVVTCIVKRNKERIFYRLGIVLKSKKGDRS
jgi:hypothetical protein